MKYFLAFFTFIFCIGCGSDDGPSETGPVLTMESFSTIEGTDSKIVYVTLRLSQVSTSPVTLSLEAIDQTATAGEDYIGFTNQEIEFAPGDVQANCQITINGDEEGEDDETFLLRIKDLVGATTTTNQVSVTIENDDGNFSVTVPSTGYSTPTSYDGMTLLWSDEFEGTSLNESVWTYEIGNGSWGWGNNELQYYRRENTMMTEGNLVIQAREENYVGFDYTSSRLITRNKFDFTFGRVDIRAVLPEGQGIWPALWMLGDKIGSVGWPACGEIDIMELVGHQPSTVHGTIHYKDAGGNHQFKGTSRNLVGGERFSEEFHVFSLEWSENQVNWYLDDQLYFSANPGTLGNENPYPFNEPFFFIFNVAVGGQWPGSPNASTSFPQNMIVDYIRVFQEN
ncbi:family 16 glycosylhydrolase [Chitinophagales bacterium]|nr:family 16 glycosylhydrolase [Chitinophagales bacterium]